MFSLWLQDLHIKAKKLKYKIKLETTQMSIHRMVTKLWYILLKKCYVAGQIIDEYSNREDVLLHTLKKLQGMQM